jgi:PncC family amidohydrolase
VNGLDAVRGDGSADLILPRASLVEGAGELADALAQARTRIVFAESCTAGLVAASLAGVPGISAWLCGSAVTYQEKTKSDWLGVTPADLETFTAVSEQVTASMAIGVLAKTTAADLAVAVTGHLGPGAPQSLDGVIFIAAAHRRVPGTRVPAGTDKPGQSIARWRFELASNSRVDRQVEATSRVLQVSKQWVRCHLSGNG